MVPNAFGIALLNSWTELPTTTRPLSWITILILLYAMIAPATPRRMLTASIVAASMDPLAVWRAQHRLLARTAAIKLVRPELLGASSDGEARLMLRRFEREAQATAALNS